MEDLNRMQFSAMSRQMEDQNKEIIFNLVEMRREIVRISKILSDLSENLSRRLRWSEYSSQNETSIG